MLFILSLLLLIVGMHFLTAFFVLADTKPYTYLAMEICISIIILLVSIWPDQIVAPVSTLIPTPQFVMYHSQTINGSRFAEMRLNDWLLASLILFHDYLILYWLTFYWQLNYEPLKPKSWDYLPQMLDLVNGIQDLPEPTSTSRDISQQLFGGYVAT